MRRLLLDFGGPCLLSTFELTDRAADSMGVAPFTWKGPFDPSTDELWQRFEAGELTERGYWDLRSAEYGMDRRTWFTHFFEPAGDHLIRPEMEALVYEELDAGRPVGILTNDMQAFHGPEWKTGISMLGRVTFIVDGSITGYLKPDPRSYAAGLEAMGCEAGEVLFVDDLPVNCRGAEAVGIPTVEFDIVNPRRSIAEIRRRLAE